MARLSRDAIVTEKIDGTNAQVLVTEDRQIYAGSRTRWITPEDDNFGFAAWVRDHSEELLELGPGRHFGEWWGQGIQRKYGLSEKRWSLFNTVRWCYHDDEPQRIVTQDPRIEKWQQRLPECCHLVPILYAGDFDMDMINLTLFHLSESGSRAAPGFMNPEGVVIYHTAANMAFKKTLGNDGAKGGRK